MPQVGADIFYRNCSWTNIGVRFTSVPRNTPDGQTVTPTRHNNLQSLGGVTSDGNMFYLVSFTTLAGDIHVIRVLDNSFTNQQDI